MNFGANFVRGRDFVEKVIKEAYHRQPGRVQVQNLKLKPSVLNSNKQSACKLSAELVLSTSQGDIAISRLKHDDIVRLVCRQLRCEGYTDFDLEFASGSADNVEVIVILNFEVDVGGLPEFS